MGENLGKDEEEESAIRIHWMKKSVFNQTYKSKWPNVLLLSIPDLNFVCVFQVTMPQFSHPKDKTGRLQSTVRFDEMSPKDSLLGS